MAKYFVRMSVFLRGEKICLYENERFVEKVAAVGNVDLFRRENQTV
jgi:hypothetical protein